MIPTSIDGTDITGATIDGTDVTEITVDGDTVFTAGVAGVAPNATILAHYPLNEGTGTVASDVTGNEPNLTFQNGPNWEAGNFIGGTRVDMTPNNSHMRMSPDMSFSHQSYSLFATVEFTKVTADDTHVFSTADGLPRTSLGIDTSSSGVLCMRTIDIGDTTRKTGRYATSVSTGQNFRVGFTQTNGVFQDFYLDGQNDTGASGFQPRNGHNGNNLGDAFFGIEGATRDHGEIKMDNIVFYDDQITSQDALDDFNAQPWS